MTGNYNDAVVSSRVRLARNVKGLPYPHKLRDDRALVIAKKVYQALSSGAFNGEEHDVFSIYRMESISEIDGNVLKEKHLISADLLKNKKYGAAVVNESETLSVMVCEEDHIREQCILPGFNFPEAYKKVNFVDDRISKSVEFDYDPKLGYLTSCPTNIGTGMRASAMMFLPGLGITRNLEKCVEEVARFNMAIRGVYGEGSEADGYLYQISNQKTLGVSEQEILSSVQASIAHIAEAELRAREGLLHGNEIPLKDKIMRAYGLLTNAYTLDTKECMRLLALVKLGAYYGYIKISDPIRLEKLATDAQPANIINLCENTTAGERINNETERDVFRAAYVARTLKNITKT